MSTICLHPKQVNGRPFPCGKCPNCRQNRRQALSDRLLLHRSFCMGSCFFVTLTYNDDNIPLYGLPFVNDPCSWYPGFSKEDVQCFFKRLRKSGLAFKYFLTCEYGELKRPHYHLLMFCEKKIRIDFFEDLIKTKWNKGFVEIGSMTDSRVSYAVKYMLKEEEEFVTLFHKYDYRMPFRLFSQGLGDNSIDFLNDYFYNCGEVRSKLVIGNKTRLLDTHLKSRLDPSIRAEMLAKLDDLEYDQNLRKSFFAHSKVDSMGHFYKDDSFDEKILERRSRVRLMKKLRKL